MSHLPYFLASFTWNYGLGMTWLVVPLYAWAGACRTSSRRWAFETTKLGSAA